MKADDLKLGDKVRDTVTGLEGIAVAVTTWLNKCVRVVVQPQEVKDGKPVESTNFDIEQLEPVTPAAVPERKRTGTGGPQNDRIATARK